MKKDWLTWVGCISLFGAGVVWGSILRGRDFFHINGIHDLAETLAGFATVIGVTLAVVGYNSWKAQAIAQSDHELSKKVLAPIRKYQPLAVDIFVIAKQLANKMYSQLGYRESPETLEVIKANLKLFKDGHSEAYAAAFECKDSWDAENWNKFDEVFSLTESCKTTVELFLLWSDQRKTDAVRLNIAQKGVAAFDVVSIFVGNDRKAVEKFLTERFDILVSEVKAKRLA
ncbi:hypothetical protein ACIOZM_02575 [Pseudomonas sp. NPDC087346]|uniref:hypothetical protein n=1 Tax=Pseudomonas sp. NPDC087346 TaxID=3364438 RepID=UPI00382AB7D0